jgi:K+/H+ antiporter YhaU regulatory subunit KhtT
MGSSVEYVYEKSIAIDNVRKILQEACERILEEKEMNKGLGYKYSCYLGKKFGVILYFKAGMSSKIVSENTPDEIKSLFNKKQEENAVEEKETQHTLPVYSSIRISNQDMAERIKALLIERFNDNTESKPKDTITNKLSILKN